MDDATIDAPQRSKNITWHLGRVSKDDRERLLGQKGCVIWFTGLSGSGKSTLAVGLEERLLHRKRLAYVLDGDNVRHGLNADLRFSPEDRDENIRRVREVAALFADAGVITIAAFISPYREGRDTARGIVPDGRFIEIYLDVPLAVCEERDPKHLYELARAGKIRDFTGIDAPYEMPLEPELRVPTHQLSVSESLDVIMQYLEDHGLLHGEALKP